MSDRYEYRVMHRQYYDADHSWVKLGHYQVGWSEWREYQSASARHNKNNTYGTLGVAKQIATAERNARRYSDGDFEVKVQKRLVRPEDWEDVDL